MVSDIAMFASYFFLTFKSISTPFINSKVIFSFIVSFTFYGSYTVLAILARYLVLISVPGFIFKHLYN